MEFDGLQIKPVKNKEESDGEKSAPEPLNYDDTAVDAMDYVVSGATVGQDLLKKLKTVHEGKKDEVVYGVYNNTNKSLFTRINDFLIDRQKVTLRDKAYFFHMLAVMVDSGMPLVEALNSIAPRVENLRFRRVLKTIAFNAEHGSTMSDAMVRFEDVFDEAEIGIVRAGEATGRLDKMLFKLSAQLTRSYAINSKLWGAAVYPIVVLCVLLLVATGMLLWIFPTLLGLLEEGGISGETLPLATRVLIGIHASIVNYWWLMLIVILIIYGTWKLYTASDYGAAAWDAKKLKIPIIGKLARSVNIWRFVSLLGILITSGLPVIKALKIDGGAIENKMYKLKIQEIIDGVRKGRKISDCMSDSDYLFPSEVKDMVRVGEISASLGNVSEKISSQYEMEIENKIDRLMAIFEPVMILVVGLFVGLLALAIMAPIFNLSNAV